MLITQPLMDRGHPHPGFELGGDVLVMLADRGPGHLTQPRISQLRKPPEQLLPLLLALRRRRDDPRRLRRRNVLTSVLRSTSRLSAISLSDRPACQCIKISVTSITSNVLLAIGPPSVPDGRKVAPSRWPGPPRHARHPHGELRERGGELRERQPLKPGNYVSADTRFPIARLRYTQATKTWTLYWRDRNLRFHRYDQLEPSPHIDDLLKEIDRDPIAIFWG